MRTLLWRDMLGVGTFVNLLVSLVALMAASPGLDIQLPAALHFAPLPCNVFLFLAVYRAPTRTGFTGAIAAVRLAVKTCV